MKLKLYVIMHKVLRINLPKSYAPLLVGSYNKISNNVLRDDEGINISFKNDNYCELTGLYWIWKNTDDDIIGMCHYRRFLSKCWFSNSKLFFLNQKKIIKLFKKNYNLILPKKHLYKTSVQNNIKVAPNIQDMKILRQVIQEISPEYIKDYDCFINQKGVYLCNVMITTKDLLNDYCEWMFKILNRVEEVMDPDTYIHDNYRKRMFGFLSERLLNIWIIHNFSKLKIKEYSLINTQEGFLKKLKYVISQIRNRIFF